MQTVQKISTLNNEIYEPFIYEFEGALRAIDELAKVIGLRMEEIEKEIIEEAGGVWPRDQLLSR